jgi:hypothetical protein
MVSNFKLGFKDSQIGKKFLRLVLLFGIPVLLFIFWLFGVLAIRLL